MRNAFSIARRIITQIGMDKRTLALIMVAPIAIITLMWVVINGGLSTPTIAVAGDPPAAYRTELDKNAKVIDTASTAEGILLVKDQKADALLVELQKLLQQFSAPGANDNRG